MGLVAPRWRNWLVVNCSVTFVSSTVAGRDEV